MKLYNRYRVERYTSYGVDGNYATTQFKLLAILIMKFAQAHSRQSQFVVVADYYSYNFPELGRIELCTTIWNP